MTQEEPPIKTKRYDELEIELDSIGQEIEDIKEVITSGDERLKELLQLKKLGEDTSTPLKYPTTSLNLLDSKLETAAREQAELEKRYNELSKLIDTFRNELKIEGWVKQIIIFGPAQWVKIKKEE